MIGNIAIVLLIYASFVQGDNGLNCYEAEHCDHFDVKHGKICCPSIDNDNGVVVCDKENFEGSCKFYSMYGKQCLNLDENGTANSVNTLNRCFRIFEHINCQGRSRPLLPGSPSHNSMNSLYMSDIITSVGLCNEHDSVIDFIRFKRSAANHRQHLYTN